MMGFFALVKLDSGGGKKSSEMDGLNSVVFRCLRLLWMGWTTRNRKKKTPPKTKCRRHTKKKLRKKPPWRRNAEGKERRKWKKKKSTTHSHAQQSRHIMLQLEILIGKRLGAIDTSTPRAIPVQEIPSLDHEILDLHTHHDPSVSFQPRWAPPHGGWAGKRRAPNQADGRLDGICSLCTLAGTLVRSWSPPCSIDGSSRRFWALCRRRVPSWFGPGVPLMDENGRVRGFGF